MKEWADRGGAFAEELLFQSLNTAKAWEFLHDQDFVSGLNMEAYLDLCLAAGYSQKASEKAARDWGLKRMQADLPA